ncbi:MAG TPA: alpha-2-macroglobulin family protein, partial [Anaerolineae bacterium]
FAWVTGPGYVNWRQENNDRIQLVADKDEYRVGDTARLLVASPYQGTVKALLSVERNHILSYKIIDVAGNSQQLEIPIEAAHAPNVFVSLTLIKGMDRSSPAPSFKVGLALLKVSVADKQLQVIATPDRSKVGPRDTVTWDVQTLDSTGKPVADADVSLALVDKAVLTLASDQSGTLMNRFYSQRAEGVRTASTLVVNVDRLVNQLTRGGKGGGGGGGGAAPGVRSNFLDNAYWRASVTTGSDGHASVTTTLPDNLTTWTLDARAVTADTRVGQSMTDIVATKDLLIRPLLPRFLVQGDRPEIGAIVQNNTGQALEVSVDLLATGLAPAEPATGKTFSIAAQGSHTFNWPVSVQPPAGGPALLDSTTITMTARGGGLADAIQLTLPAYHYTTPEVTGTSGQVESGDSRLELVRLPSGADPARGGLNVSIEPSLAAGMTGGLTYLEHYPYECTEQTVSRFLPNVVTYQALKSLGISRPDLETALPEQVGIGLQKLYAGQQVDGGWGWWRGDGSDLFVSSYVVFGLAKAQKAGFAVDRTVLDRGVRFVRQGLAAPAGLENWRLNRQAFMVYALAVAGDNEPNRAGA